MYRGIAFEGGGITGLAHIGALEVLDDQKIYSQLTHFAGSSAGSVFATLAACRYSPTNMRKMLLEMDIRKLKSSPWLIVMNIYRLIEQYGWYDGSIIEKTAGDLLEEVSGDRNITFKQIMNKWGSFLIITTTNVNTGETEYLSPETTPDMTVAHAIYTSSSLPPLFPPVLKDCQYYVDGGLLNNYPIRVLYKYIPEDSVIGIKLVGPSEPRSYTKKDQLNVVGYLCRLVELLHDQNLKIHVEDADWERTIKVKIGKVSATDFDITDQQKILLIDKGRIAALQYFVWKNN